MPRSSGLARSKAVNIPAMVGGVATLPARGRWARAVAAIAVIAATLVGTLVGTDDSFPFGPFRMYSTSTNPNRWVVVIRLEARTEDGVWHRAGLNPSSIGVNRAEVEGQINDYRRHPERLRNFVVAHTKLRPDLPRWTGARLVEQRLLLRNRRYIGTTESVTAEWTAS
jgi:hypothetical protein